MYQHLFVPVDGSELSHRAMDGSIALAKQLGARITGFVVEPDVGMPHSGEEARNYAKLLKDNEAQNETHAKALLGQFEARAAAAGVPFAAQHATSDAVDDTIVSEAEQCGCDMIVIVTHGRGKLGELLFGSHTHNIIQRSKLPVFVLH